MGAYIIWYTVVPATFGGKIFSDALTRLAFILLLLFSTPVGIHHQFVDPGISAGWKWLHMLLTYGVVVAVGRPGLRGLRVCDAAVHSGRLRRYRQFVV